MTLYACISCALMNVITCNKIKEQGLHTAVF